MVDDIVYVLREVVSWLKGRGPSDEAIAALVKALHATEAYLYDRAKHGEDRRREVELVNLWTDCAVLLRNTNPGLAESLNHKARSWAVPDEYKYSDIKKLGIEIRTIRKEVDSLFGNQK